MVQRRGLPVRDGRVPVTVVGMRSVRRHVVARSRERAGGRCVLAGSGAETVGVDEGACTAVAVGIGYRACEVANLEARPLGR